MQTSDLTAVSRTPDPVLDAIDGVLPGTIVEPQTREGVAATLAWAHEHSLSLVIRGSGSKIGWGAVPQKIDVLLDMSPLNRVLTHQSGDLTVSVEAGVRLNDLNQRLREQGQWLALDPSSADAAAGATIGGLLATNDSGPQRHRHGTPRDLVIGIEVATTDGRIAKAGGQVVKNVAGYDLSKIMSGSFGSLAAIVSATFKLSPVPAASATLAIDDLDRDAAVAAIAAIVSSQLEPVAFELIVTAARGDSPAIACLVRFASLAQVVDAETANASARIAAAHSRFRILAGDEEQRFWMGHGQRPWDQPGIVARASWLPGDVGSVISAVQAFSEGATVELVGRIGAGAGFIRIDGDRAAQLDVIARLRAAKTFGNVVVLRAPAELKSREWVWGAASAPALGAALKRELDPGAILGAGRGPL